MIALLVVLVAVAAVVFLAWAAIRDLLGQSRDQRHLDRLTAAESTVMEEGWVERGAVERRLLGVGLAVGPATFLVVALVLALAAYLALDRLIPNTPVAALAGAAVAVYVLWIILGALSKRRAKKFEESLTDAVALMIAALKAGENLTQALSSAAEASLGAVRREFREAARRLGLGMTIRRALQPISDGYDSRGTRLFTQTVIAKWQAGGDLVPVLEIVNGVIRERIRLRWKVDRSMAAVRLAAGMVALMPYVFIPYFLWQRPDWIERLQTHPWGPRLFFMALLLQLVGLLWVRRLLRIEI